VGRGIIFVGIGFELVGTIMGGYYIGGFVDQKMGWNHVCSVVLILILFVTWFIHLLYLLRRFEQEDSHSDSDPKP
jgi:hypothetical protein